MTNNNQATENFIDNLLHTSAITMVFNEEELQQANSISIAIDDYSNRHDLRHLAFVTIDGDKALDFDDAVYCESNASGFRLYVAVADVAHYVTQDSPLDNAAYLRGTSLYFPNMVIPMLPEILSNTICSLQPLVDRLVMVCSMDITPAGHISNEQIYHAVINSKARLTYTQVQCYIDNNFTSAPAGFVNTLQQLYVVYQLLLNNRKYRGAIDFDSAELSVVFAANGIATSMIKTPRNSAQRIIEECMLAANVAIANFVSQAPEAIYRIHEYPDSKKLLQLKTYLAIHAIPFDVLSDSIKPKDIAKLILTCNKHPQFANIQQEILRALQLACYSTKDEGHFGLAYPRYLHFTSPIRRYPDLITHRICKALLNAKSQQYSRSLTEIAEHSSFCERRAEDLERNVMAYYKCCIANNYIGNDYIGTVTAVANFGLFVHIDCLMLDGLLHITQLGSGYFIYSATQNCLIGKKNGLKYSNGQQLAVKIIGVNLIKLFIDLQLVA
jgi:ribonuclease R